MESELAFYAHAIMIILTLGFAGLAAFSVIACIKAARKLYRHWNDL